MTGLLENLLIPGVSIPEKIIRVLLVYVFLLVILRLVGRRQLAQMNEFDFVVLLVLSNTVQNAIIGNDNSLIGGLVGAAALIAANVLVNRFVFHHPRLARRLEGEPVFLIRGGKVLEANLRRQEISEDELLERIRSQGLSSFADCEQVVLETTGAISVLPRQRPMPEMHELLAKLGSIEQQLQHAAAGQTKQGLDTPRV